MQYQVIWHSFDGKFALTACGLVLFKKGGQWYSTNSPKYLRRVELLREAEATEQGIEDRRNRRHGQ
jgi:hypothetical protein